MSRISSQLQTFTARLIAHESGQNKAFRHKTPAAQFVCAKLGRHLAGMMGQAGFRSLQTRALALAAADVAWLRVGRVGTDGVVKGLSERGAQLDPQDEAEGAVALVAHLLALLAVFVGENLTLRIVHEVWPKQALPELGFNEGNSSHEKSK